MYDGPMISLASKAVKRLWVKSRYPKRFMSSKAPSSMCSIWLYCK